jgi:GTPase SAR1 family protein
MIRVLSKQLDNGNSKNFHKIYLSRRINLLENLEEFSNEPVISNSPHCRRVTETSNDDNEKEKLDIITPNQWTYIGKDSLVTCTSTEKTLRPGYYEIGQSQGGQIVFKKREILTDDLIDFPDSLSDKILQEIIKFWGTNERFLRYGVLHRRGYLLYGPPGSGKTCLIHQISKQIILKDGIIFDCKNPRLLTKALENFREVEPFRPLVCIFEDLDSIIRDFGDDDLLKMLDGENLIDRVLNIATTNYPELLDRRLVGRPRRFDRVIKINMPSRTQREIFFRNRLLEEDLKIIPFENWIDKTEGFSFAALAELIISVLCLDNDFDEIIKILNKLLFEKASSDEYIRKSKTGF